MKPVIVLSRRNLLGAAVSLFPAVRLIGQESEKPSFSTDVKVINVFATVHDKNGKIVNGLAKDDFVLEEDGRPQTIRYFSQQSNLPLTLGLLVDTSGSERRMIPEERQASEKFFEQVLRPDRDKAFLIHFDREVELLQDLTSSRERLEKSLALLQTSEPDQQQGAGGTRPVEAVAAIRAEVAVAGIPGEVVAEAGEEAAPGAAEADSGAGADQAPAPVIAAERRYTMQFSSHPTN